MERPEYRAGRVERAVKTYTVCDESRYLIVRNVPALGCIDELIKLFGLYGDIEEYRLLDEEECQPYTDVYWIKYSKYSNSRFAKRKLDNYKFLGNLLDVSYAPNYESLADTKSKLEERRRAVLFRIQVNQGGEVRRRQVESRLSPLKDPLLGNEYGPQQLPSSASDHLPWDSGSRSVDVAGNLEFDGTDQELLVEDQDHTRKQHFSTAAMNDTVQLVREKLNKISEINVMPPPAMPDRHHEADTKGIDKHEENLKRSGVGDTTSLASKKQQDKRRRI